MTKALQPLLEEGHPVDMQALSTLSQYRTEHIKRGRYKLPTLCHPVLAEQLPKYISHAFGSLDKPWKPGYLRSAYGAICCHLFKPNASLSVGQSYKDFYIRKP